MPNITSIPSAALAVAALSLVTAASAEPMRFTAASNGGNCGTPCNWIAAEGEITVDTPRAFERFVGADPLPGQLVVLHSPGGSVTAAMELGRAFRRHGVLAMVARSGSDPQSRTLQVLAPGSCMSACAIAFMGARQRFYDDGMSDTQRPWWSWETLRSRLGVHQFYIDRAAAALDQCLPPGAELAVGMSISQVLSGALVAYAIDIGVDPRVVTLSASAGPEGMRVLSRDEAIALRLSNAPDPLPAWSLRPHRGGLALFAEGALDVRRSEATIACRPAQAGQPPALAFRVSTRPGFGQSNIVEPERVLREQLQPSWRGTGAGLRETMRLPAVSDGAWFRGGVSTVSVVLDARAIDVLRRGGRLEFESGLSRATGFLTLPVRFDLPDAAQLVPLLQRNCPRA
jgi:hypothetical protein